jgi:membrane protein
MGAALAFYSAVSLAPMLVIAIAIAGVVFGTDTAEHAVVHQLTGLLGVRGAGAVRDMVAATRKHGSGDLATAIGVAALLVGAGSVFVELQAALDRIWKVPARQGGTWTQFIRSQLLSFGLVLVIGFLLLMSLVITTLIAGFTAYFSGRLPHGGVILLGVDFLLAFMVGTLLFAFIYKWLPKVTIAWRDVWVGAAVTALLFDLGRVAVGLYLGRSAAESAYGVGGAFVVLLLWLYYSAQIFLYGAEFTKIYAQNRHAAASASARDERPRAEQTST